MYVVVLLALLVPLIQPHTPKTLQVTPLQVSTGWWGGWEFGARVRFAKPTTSASIIVVKGISNDECMQAVTDNRKHNFHLSYQHKSANGFQCEERWCLRESESITSVRVWGSAIWTGVRHSVSATEFPADSVPCGEK